MNAQPAILKIVMTVLMKRIAPAKVFVLFVEMKLKVWESATMCCRFGVGFKKASNTQ